MFAWGLTLAAVGFLSFVLPLFGRQFIVVSAIGLSGAGSIGTGLLLLAIGVALMWWANAGNTSPSVEFGTQENLQSNLTSAPLKAASNLAGTVGTFIFGANGSVSPYHLGLAITKYGLENSEKIVEQMIGDANLPSQKSIDACRGPVQMHMLALVAAAWYVCADRECYSNKAVNSKVAEGLVNGLTAIFAPEVQNESARNNALAIYDLVRDYGQSLAREAQEMHEAKDNNFADMGPTARLVIDNIAGQCGMQQVLVDSPLERMMLENLARGFGLVLLLNLQAKQELRYQPLA